MKLTKPELTSLVYHDRFIYPMTKEDLKKWKAGKFVTVGNIKYDYKNGYFFVKGKEKNINLRLNNESHSARKLIIAKKALSAISLVPYIKFVGITGSLAMANAKKESDIDFLIITQKGTLWLSRIISYILLKIFRIRVRKPNDNDQRDALCLNMWFDESDLEWPINNRNYFTSHEFAQVVPIYNKDNMYEKLLDNNRWILKYWPNAVVINKQKKYSLDTENMSLYFLEKLAHYLQYCYMKKKITKEVATDTRAIFHPRQLVLGKKFQNI